MAEIPWDLRRRALKDSIRHDKRVKEAIRKNLKELIAEENIITSDGKKLVKIPLRYLDQYRFRFGQLGTGTGQGKGHVGDTIAREGEPGDVTGPTNSLKSAPSVTRTCGSRSGACSRSITPMPPSTCSWTAAAR